MRTFVALFTFALAVAVSQASESELTKGHKCSWTAVYNAVVKVVDVTGPFCDQLYGNRTVYDEALANCVSQDVDDKSAMVACFMTASATYAQEVSPLAIQYIQELVPICKELAEDLANCQ